MYCFCEYDSADVEKSVCEVFSSIGEQPHMGHCICMRLGSKSGAKPWPIKVVLAVRTQRYVCERVDSGSERTQAPDRIWEERLERKNLVDLMKAKTNSDPSKHYYITGSPVMCNDSFSRLVMQMDSWRGTVIVVQVRDRLHITLSIFGRFLTPSVITFTVVVFNTIT